MLWELVEDQQKIPIYRKIKSPVIIKHNKNNNNTNNNNINKNNNNINDEDLDFDSDIDTPFEVLEISY